MTSTVVAYSRSRSSSSSSRRRSSTLSLTSPKFRPSLDLFTPHGTLPSLKEEGLETLPAEIFHHICSFLHPVSNLSFAISESTTENRNPRKDLLNLAKVNKRFYSTCQPLLFHTVDLRYTSVHALTSFVNFALYNNASSIRCLLWDFSSLNLFPQDNPALSRATLLSKILTTVENLRGLYLHFGGLDSRNRWMNEPTVMSAFRELIEAVKDVGTSYSLRELEIFGPAPRPYTIAIEVLDGLLGRHGKSLTRLTVDRWTEEDTISVSRISQRVSETTNLATFTLRGTFSPFRTLPPNLESLKILNPVSLDFFKDVYSLLKNVKHSLVSFEWSGDSMLPDGFSLRGAGTTARITDQDDEEIRCDPIHFTRLQHVSFHPDSLSQSSSEYWEDELESLFLNCFAHEMTPLKRVEYSRNSHHMFIRSLKPLMTMLQSRKTDVKTRERMESVVIGRSKEWNWVREEEWRGMERWRDETETQVILNARVQ